MDDLSSVSEAALISLSKSAIGQLNWPVLLKARNLASRITPEKENLTSNGYVY